MRAIISIIVAFIYWSIIENVTDGMNPISPMGLLVYSPILIILLLGFQNYYKSDEEKKEDKTREERQKKVEKVLQEREEKKVIQDLLSSSNTLDTYHHWTDTKLKLTNVQNILNSWKKYDEFYIGSTEEILIDYVDNSIGTILDIETIIVYCKAYWKYNLESDSSKFLLKEAYNKEKERKFDEASSLYKRYLNSIQFQFFIDKDFRYYEELNEDVYVRGIIASVDTRKIGRHLTFLNNEFEIPYIEKY